MLRVVRSPVPPLPSLTVGTRTAVVALVVLLGIAACTPAKGRFCRKDSPDNCWDLDLRENTATVVFANGKAAPKSIALTKADDVWSGEGLGDDRIEFRVVDSDTISLTNTKSKNEPIIFVRQRP